MIPMKLQAGDELRVISPAESMTLINDDTRNLAIKRLEEMGLIVSFSTYAYEDRPSIAQRVSDIHEAFLDPNVKIILTTIGGYNSNQLLSYIDYDLISKKPKIFCGFSDITALANAIYKKTGLVTYSGPHFSTLGMKKGISYTVEHFKNTFFNDVPFTIQTSDLWSDDAWFLDQEKRIFHNHDGYEIINEGHAVGTSIGGNLCTLNLLQGTEFMPPLESAILLLEDDLLSNVQTFDRDLQSLIHQPGFANVKGLIIGRFQEASNVSLDSLKEVIQTKDTLTSIPVIAKASFGHTTPQFTFPIGGKVQLSASNHHVSVRLIEF
ncbi:S66 family peptidase [Halobacillus seohaensis]|uniref:S66 peptidase family protein n=1 Tax=Halobacillus seohaensis TaxID=447421 RepID=A0ABW2EMJ6_9BACI